MLMRVCGLDSLEAICSGRSRRSEANNISVKGKKLYHGYDFADPCYKKCGGVRLHHCLAVFNDNIARGGARVL